MSAPVDVLAVLDRAIESASLMVKASGDMRAVAYQDDLFKARAAVAELIEALDGLDHAYCRAGPQLTRDERMEDRKRLIAARAALARAKGGAA